MILRHLNVHLLNVHLRAPRRPALNLAAGLLGLALLLPAGSPAQAGEECFIAADLATGRVHAKQGLCATRQSPASTFKIPLALMGFETGLLKSPSLPVFEEPTGPHTTGPENWRGPQTPRTWMERSVVWVSQILAAQLGKGEMERFLKAFAYGNENLSGNTDAPDGYLRAWLSSSLRISPREQLDFLRRLLKGALPVSAEAVDKTVEILELPERPAGWLLHGKTGTGFALKADGSLDRQRPLGWFIGWAQKDEQTVVFVRFLSLDTPSAEPLGPLARRQSVTALVPVLSALAP